MEGSLTVQDYVSLRGRLLHLRFFLGFYRAELYPLFQVPLGWRALDSLLPSSALDLACLDRWRRVCGWHLLFCSVRA